MRCFSSRAAAPLRSFSSVAAPLRKRNVMRLGDAEPIVSNDAWVAPCATVAGKVLLYDASSVWFGAVVRADHGHTIRIGAMAAVQEKAVIQTVASLASGFPPDVRVGNYARVGAGATLISCHVGHFAQIGEGAIIGEGAVVEDHAAVAPNSVVAAGRLVKKGEYWAGNPAEFVRELEEEEIDAHNAVAEQNVWAASNHAHEFPPYHGTAFRELTYASADAPRAESGPPKSPLDAPRPTLPRTSTRV